MRWKSVTTQQADLGRAHPVCGGTQVQILSGRVRILEVFAGHERTQKANKDVHVL